MMMMIHVTRYMLHVWTSQTILNYIMRYVSPAKYRCGGKYGQIITLLVTFIRIIH